LTLISFKFSETFQEAEKTLPQTCGHHGKRKSVEMIFRAMIGIGLALLLASHQSELGLGHPGAGISLPSLARSTALTGSPRPVMACESNACAGGLGRPRNLADIKAEIDASLKARARPFTAF
jgi:hypothetical protein